MSYARLYDAIQGRPIYIKRNVIRDEILSITGIDKVSIIKTSRLTLNVCRGIYISPLSIEHPFACTVGQHAILISRDLNRCWERLIIVKELMHLLDGDSEAIDTGEKFDRVLSEIFVNSGTICPQTRSEFRALWMALGVLVPEKIRLSLRDEWIQAKSHGVISADLDIAHKLKIPAIYIPFLFSPTYAQEVGSILGRPLTP